MMNIEPMRLNVLLFCGCKDGASRMQSNSLELLRHRPFSQIFGKVSEKSAKLYRFASPFMNIFTAEGFEEVYFPLNQVKSVGGQREARLQERLLGGEHFEIGR